MFSKDTRTISKEFHAFRFTVLARAKEFIDSNFSSCSATLLSQLYSLPFVWNLVASTCFLHLLPVSSFKVSFSSLSFLLWLPVFFISPLLFTPILPSFFPSSTFVNNLFFVFLLRSFRSFIFLFPPSNSVQRNLHPLFLSCSYFHLSFFLSASPTLYLLLYVYLTAILLLYRSATLPPPPTSSLFLLFLFLRGPSSFSVRRPSPNLAPVLSSTRARGLLFAFTLYFSPSRRFLSSSQVYSHSPTAAQRRQHCRNWSIEERFFEEAANTNASGCCRCYCRRHRPPTLL